MSLPKIPNITPNISLKRCETINLLLSSIALEEIGLSHILNAEGEKLQHFLKACPESLNDFLIMNESNNKTLRTIVNSQILLQFKMEDVIGLDKESCCEKCSKKKSGFKKYSFKGNNSDYSEESEDDFNESSDGSS